MVSCCWRRDRDRDRDRVFALPLLSAGVLVRVLRGLHGPTQYVVDLAVVVALAVLESASRSRMPRSRDVPRARDRSGTISVLDVVGGSADPQHVEDVDPSLVIEDQIGDHPFAGRSEDCGPDRAVGLGAVQGITAPRGDLEHDPRLGEGSAGSDGQCLDLWL